MLHEYFHHGKKISNSPMAYLFDPYVKYCSDMKLLFAFEIQDAQSGERKGKQFFLNALISSRKQNAFNYSVVLTQRKNLTLFLRANTKNRQFWRKKQMDYQLCILKSVLQSLPCCFEDGCNSMLLRLRRYPFDLKYFLYKRKGFPNIS